MTTCAEHHERNGDHVGETTTIPDADVAKLRRELQMLRWIVATIAISLLMSWSLGAAESLPTVETQGLLLRDADGKVRARLEATRLGPRLVLLSDTGVVGLEFGIVDGAFGIGDSIEEDGTERSVRVRDTESSYLNLYDALGNERLSFRVNRYPDRAAIVVSDAAGQPIWTEPKAAAGEPPVKSP